MTKRNIQSSDLPTSVVSETLSQWQSATLYTAGQQVAYQNQHYACLQNHTSGATFPGVGADWVLFGQNAGYVDICAAFGVSTAVTDNGPLINTALSTLGPLGLAAFISKPGVYPIKTPIVLGNGSTTAAATWSGRLIGAGMPGGPNVTGANTGTVQTMLQWQGAATTNALMTILGPLVGWEISNIRLDGGSTSTIAPLWGLVILSAVRGRSDNLEVTNCMSGIEINTQAGKPSGYSNVDSLLNKFTNTHIQYVGKAGNSKTYGVTFQSAGISYGNTCYQEFDTLWITAPSTSVGDGRSSYDLYFQGCDSNLIRNITCDGTQGGTDTHYATYWDFAQTNIWPAGNVIDKCDFGGVQHGTAGTCSTAGNVTNSIMNLSCVNGQAGNPQIQALKWGNMTYNGSVTLVNGTATITSVHTVQPGSFVRVWPIAPGGTPGQLFVTSRTGSQFVITSYQPGTTTTQTTDTSLVWWEVVTDPHF